METRTVKLEMRAEKGEDGEGRTLKGMAIVYDAEADLGDFIERIKAGSLTKTLAGKRNIRARFEHQDLLASKDNGTLTLTDTDNGLAVQIDVAKTRAGDDAIALVDRGDIEGMSFGFRVMDQTFTKENGKLYRDINEIDLYEVTITDSPAYGATSIAKRSVDQGAIQQARKLADKPTLTDRRMTLRRMQAAA